MYFEAKIQKDGKGYRIFFPGLDNVLTYADTKEKALKSAQEALVGCLLEDMDRGFDLPVPVNSRKKKGTHLIPVPASVGAALIIRKLRYERKWTTQQVAMKLGISRQAYEKLERGTGNPSIITLEKTLSVFGAGLDLTIYSKAA